MSKTFKITKTEKILRAINHLLRFMPSFNELENHKVSEDFNVRLREIKEQNSQIVFDAYYVPKATVAILREENYLATEETIKNRATAMLLTDVANGTLNEFYRFIK